MSNEDTLPTDMEACHALIRQVNETDETLAVQLEIARFELEQLKRACSKCKQTVKVAPPPEAEHGAAALTAGSRYGFAVTAQIIRGKYADHLPLYRMEDVFARAGVVIPRSTQVDLLAAAADVLTPLSDLLKERLLLSPFERTRQAESRRPLSVPGGLPGLGDGGRLWGTGRSLSRPSR